MCNRYKLERIDQIKQMMRDVYGVDVDTIDWSLRYNIAPNQMVPVVATDEAGKPVAQKMRWNLIPKDEKPKKPLTEGGPIPQPPLRTNARAETVLKLWSYRYAIQRRRCLVPADGFYEWEHLDGGKIKIPWLFQLPKGRPFMFAGIWEPATPERPPTFSILTTRPNDMLARFHDRMPTMLLDEVMAMRWLAPGEMTEGTLAPFVEPYPATLMETYQVNRAIGNPRNDTAEAAARVGLDASYPAIGHKAKISKADLAQGELF